MESGKDETKKHPEVNRPSREVKRVTYEQKEISEEKK